VEYRIENGLENLKVNFISLYLNLDLFRQLGEIINSNDDLRNKDQTLSNWIKQASTVDLVVGMYRLVCDKSPKANSLYRFLKELKSNERNKIYLTRERYVSLYKTPKAIVNLGKEELTEDEKRTIARDIALRMAKRDIDELAGVGQESFQVDRIEKDMKKISEKEPFKKIRTFRDQYVAHNDYNKVSVQITYSELYRAFEVAEEIFKKYYKLITASSILDLTPTIQGNWKEVLTIPWIGKK
jgi:hypothetical protein